MPTFAELKDRYMLTHTPATGGSLSGSPGTSIPAHTNCKVEPLVHGTRYFPALKAAINAVGSGGFIYLTGWWMKDSFSLDGSSGASVADLLKAKAKAGVDVRVMGWVMAPEVLNSRLLRASLGSGLAGGLTGMLDLNDDTIQLITTLRAEPALADKAVLNILSHPAGAVHMKFALVGTESSAVGFTGGIDMETFRWDASWHDVQVKASGAVLSDFYGAFRDMWNEVRSRSVVRLTGRVKTADSHTTSMPNLPSRTVTGTAGTLHVQSLRTLPRMNFSTIASTVLPTNQPLSYATSGLFQIRQVWEKALKAADNVIYMEDQGFFSAEIFDWINETIKAQSGLRVILLTGQADPNDAPNNMLAKFFAVAINNHLLKGIPAGSPILDRIGVFSHRSKVIHTKATLVDDTWAMIGSANAMRRSLYTDMEHNVAYMDEQGLAVPQHRAALWQPHLGSSITNLASGIAAWFAIPFQGTPGSRQIDRLRLPLTTVTLTAQEQTIYDEVMDVDSRQVWGTGLARAFMSGGGAVTGSGS